MSNFRRLAQALLIVAFSYFFGIANVWACTATIVYAGDFDSSFPDDKLEQGQYATASWFVENRSSCDAINYRLAFHESTPSTNTSNFGGDSHPTFSINAGDTGWVEVNFYTPQEMVDFERVDFDILDENGNALAVLPKGRLWINFTVTESPDNEKPVGTISEIATCYTVGQWIEYSVSASDDKALEYLLFSVDENKQGGSNVYEKSWQANGVDSFPTVTDWFQLTQKGSYFYTYEVLDKAGKFYTDYGVFEIKDSCQLLDDDDLDDDDLGDGGSGDGGLGDGGSGDGGLGDGGSGDGGSGDGGLGDGGSGDDDLGDGEPPPPPPPPCYPTVKAVIAEDSLDEPVEPAQSVTFEWQVENDQDCDASGFELVFNHATLNGSDYTDGSFGGNTPINVGAGQTASVSVNFSAPETPKEGGDFTVVYDILDENGQPTGEQLTGTFTVDPCLSIEPPKINYVDSWMNGEGSFSLSTSATDETGEMSVGSTCNDESNTLSSLVNGDYGANTQSRSFGMNSCQISASNMCGGSTFGPLEQPPSNSGDFGKICPCDECPCKKESSKKSTVKCVGDPCNTSDGNFVHSVGDAVISGLGGTTIELERTYNSLAALWTPASIVRYTDNGDTQEVIAGPPQYFGQGWTSPFGMYLLVVDKAPIFEGVQILYPDGHTALFAKEGDGYVSDSTANFDTLVVEGDDYVLTQKDSLEKVRFNADGHIIEISDRNDNKITFTYTDDLLTRVENASGRSVTFTHNAEGQIVQATLPEGITLSYEYSDGLLTAFVDGKGNRTEYQYDDNKQLTKITTPKGHPKIQTTYDADDWRVTQQIVGESELYALAYNEDATITTVTDAYGIKTLHHYDEQGRIVQVDYPDGTTKKYAYDEDSNRIYYQDQAGTEWHSTYDERGNRLTAEGPLGWYRAWEYNEQNQVISMQERVDADTLRAFTFEYDTAGNVIKVCMPLGDCATIEYDAHGLPTHFTDLANHSTTNEYDVEGDLIAVTNAEGATTRFEHDGLGRLIKLQKPLGNAYQYSYDPNSNLTTVSGPLGYQLSFVFDANDNVITQIDPNQGEIHYDYNLSDKVVKIENQINAVKQYTYGLMGELQGFQDAEGRAWTLTRDELSRITQIQGPLGSRAEFAYNAVGKLVDAIDAAGRVDHTIYDELYRTTSVVRNYKPVANPNADTNVTTHYLYNLLGDVLQVTDAEGYTTHYKYDLQGRTVSKQDAEGYEWQYTYDPMGNVLSVLNPRGYSTQLEYTPSYRVHKIIDPEQHALTLLYNANGKLTDKTDRNGVVTHNEYNELDRLIRRIQNYQGGLAANQATNVQTTFEYDLAGNLRFLTNPRGFTAELRYDATHRRTEVIDFEQGSTRLVYDKVDNVLQAIDANGHATAYQYNDLDQLVAMTNAENETQQFEYDVVGNLIAWVEADGTKTVRNYDALYRLNGVTENFQAEALPTHDVNVATQYGYSPRGLLTSILNANAQTTVFEYDKIGQVIREIDPLNAVWTYAYDGVGNQVARVDAKGNETQYRYFPDDQLQEIRYFDNSTVQYAYDANNNRIAMQDNLGQTTWQYDPLNRRIAQNDPFSRVLQSVYDAASNRTGLIYPDGNEMAYRYSPNNWLAQAIDPEGQVTRYNRDKVGNITYTENPNQTVTETAYDKVYRVTSLINRQIAGAKKTHSAFAYTYNLVGHVTQVVKEYGWQQPDEITETYGYDGLHRLATVMIEPLKNNGDAVAMAYRYDAVGNRLTWESNDDLTTHEPFDGFSKTYTYNAGNQLLKEMMASDKPNGDLETLFSYDANGNRINKLLNGEHGVEHFSTEYRYDPENRLTVAQNYQVATNDKRTDRDVTWLDYDGGGRRLASHYDPKLNQPKGGGVDKEIQYVFDGLEPVAEYEMLNGQRTDYYRGAGNHLLAMHQYKGGTQGNMFWYHFNSKGDVSGLSKHNGNAHHTYRYDPYGAVVPENGNFTEPHNAYTLTGKETDGNTGLVYFGARHYDPSVGVWVTQDLYRGSLATPGSLHRFSYVIDNPINLLDTNGFWSTSTHQQAVYDVICQPDKLTQSECDALKQAQKDADSDNNASAENAFRHAMRNTGWYWEEDQSEKEARAMANNFVHNQFEESFRLREESLELKEKVREMEIYIDEIIRHTTECRDQLSEEDIDDIENLLIFTAIASSLTEVESKTLQNRSLEEFSIGLHALQDWTTPSHHGFKPWSGYTGIGGDGENIAFHFYKENFNPGKGSNLYRITRDAWSWYEKGELPSGDLFEGYKADRKQPNGLEEAAEEVNRFGRWANENPQDFMQIFGGR